MEYNLNELYNVYMAQYNKSMENSGGRAAEVPQTRAEFEVNFKEAKVALKESGAHRLSGTQISQKLARADVYEHSLKQARSIQEWARKSDFDNVPSIAQIRAGDVPEEFWQKVSDVYRAQRQDGKSAKQAQVYISTHIFGSA